MPLTHTDDGFKESKLNGIFENQPTRIRHKSTRCCDATGFRSLTSPKHHVSTYSEGS